LSAGLKVSSASPIPPVAGQFTTGWMELPYRYGANGDKALNIMSV